MRASVDNNNCDDNSDDDRWRAVLARDPSASFFYGVCSTGVYCFPSCASRRPTRSKVLFFETAEAAVRAGFRACRRCRPTDAADGDPWTMRIVRACQAIERVQGHASLADLARSVGGSPYHLQRLFLRHTGVTPRQYAEACRLRRVKRALKRGDSVTAAIVDAGYGSSSRFYERAAPKLAMAPAKYRQGASDTRIRYTIVDSPLGWLLVASTERGVCAVRLGASAGALTRELEQEFRHAMLVRDDDGLGRQAAQVVALVAGRRPRQSLPLDVQATAFQWQVWNALTAIPRGQTRTYTEVANAIGRPGAARAVARACATNPVAIVVPCHRVVPAAGGVGGYRWGVSTKKALLDLEARVPRAVTGPNRPKKPGQ
jgi:AraC family transcriptional regulator of adaptative response/methylated-DNA-[protein]-cysteine methyltransferase